MSTALKSLFCLSRALSPVQELRNTDSRNGRQAKAAGHKVAIESEPADDFARAHALLLPDGADLSVANPDTAGDVAAPGPTESAPPLLALALATMLAIFLAVMGLGSFVIAWRGLASVCANAWKCEIARNFDAHLWWFLGESLAGGFFSYVLICLCARIAQPDVSSRR